MAGCELKQEMEQQEDLYNKGYDDGYYDGLYCGRVIGDDEEIEVPTQKLEKVPYGAKFDYTRGYKRGFKVGAK